MQFTIIDIPAPDTDQSEHTETILIVEASAITLQDPDIEDNAWKSDATGFYA